MIDENISRQRFMIVRILTAVAFLLLLGRLIYMQVYKGDFYLKKSEANMVRCVPIPADRGVILSRYGETLVKNNPGYTVSLLCFELKNPTLAVMKIAEILHLSNDETKNVLRQIQMNPSEPIRLKDFIEYDELARLVEISGDYPGIYLESNPKREYPMKEGACHIAGYIGEINLEELESLSRYGYEIGDIVGKEGLEKQYDRYLKGSSGARQVLVDVGGKMVRFVGEIPPKTGSTVVLNIDRELQVTAERALHDNIVQAEIKNRSPVAGAVVALSPSTGEVLCMASYPRFDPNLFSKGITKKDYDRLVLNRECPLLNRAIHCAYPCASTFKMITGSEALEEGLVKEGSGFHCSGVLDVGGTPFNCFVRSGHGDLDFVQAIAYSCDVVFYMLAGRVDLQKYLQTAREFGMGSRTGIDLPGEAEGLLPTPEWKEKTIGEQWYAGDTVNLSIGQGYLGVTPLQLAVATSAVANGGMIFEPHLVRRIISSEGKAQKEFSPRMLRQVPVSEENLAVIRKGMRGAVTHGTATSANSALIEISGKTGTAENFPSADNPSGRNHAWFTCFAPYDNPEIVVTVFLEKSGGFGGEWGAPVARKIIEAYARKKKREDLP